MDRIAQNIRRIFDGLDLGEQIELRGIFLESLTYGYHKRFFKRLPERALINERWFQQFLVSGRNPRAKLFADVWNDYADVG